MNRLKHFWYYITSRTFRIFVSNTWYLKSEENKNSIEKSWAPLYNKNVLECKRVYTSENYNLTIVNRKYHNVNVKPSINDLSYDMIYLQHTTKHKSYSKALSYYLPEFIENFLEFLDFFGNFSDRREKFFLKNYKHLLLDDAKIRNNKLAKVC